MPKLDDYFALLLLLSLSSSGKPFGHFPLKLSPFNIRPHATEKFDTELAYHPTALPPIGNAIRENELSQISSSQLAFIGDSVYELYSRTKDLQPDKKKIASSHESAKVMACAETQSLLLRRLMANVDSEFELSSREKQILRTGHNNSPRGPSRVSYTVYCESTALETLLGYLYLSDRFRLQIVLGILGKLFEINSCAADFSRVDWR